MRSVIATALALVTAASVLAADDWPQFRGTRAGVAPDDPNLPETWSETENVV
jgi:hypothetical protein